MAEWFEKDDFWEDLEPFMFPPARFEAAAGEMEQVLALTGVEGGSVLDLCCGPGRHSVALAKRGFQVTGIDRFARFLERGRAHAAEAGVSVEFAQSDMREFVRADAFDLAISMFTSFGYFAAREDNLTVLRNIHRNLRRGGKLLIDVAAKEWCAGNFNPTTSQALDDGTILVERHEVIDNWSKMRNEWILIRGEKAKTFKFEHWIYSAAEMQALLETAGFKEIEVCGDFDGQPFGVGSKRLVAIGRRVN